jgi:hypothetical protein
MIDAWLASVAGTVTPAAELICGSHKNPAITKTPANPSFCSMTDVLPAKLLWRTDPPCCNEEPGAEFRGNAKLALLWLSSDWQKCIAAAAQAAMVSVLLKTGSIARQCPSPKAACRASHGPGAFRRTESVCCDGVIGVS